MTDPLQHSAEIDMYLLIGGERFEVASCLGNRCSVRAPRDIPPCDGELVIVVDGHRLQKSVRLAQGMCGSRSELEFDVVSELISGSELDRRR